MRRISVQAKTAPLPLTAAAWAARSLLALDVGPTRSRGSMRSNGAIGALSALAANRAASFPTSSSTIPFSRGYASLAPEPAAKKPLFDKILIANRGEIACRVIRTARRLGIRTVAVFSEVDKNALHVQEADEAYYIGRAPSAESYLNMEKYIDICKKSGAQAVHPGYGFLSENADFAKLLAENGIVFIGPSASAITSMGSKAESKDIMLAAGVPCVPGWHPSSSSDADNQSPAFLLKEADKIGYPVLIKAVSGGGGKGMKIVSKREEFEAQLAAAKRESKKHFSDDTVLLERYITRPRHVEVQIFSDSHGNHLSLFERDCSVQRRHQKIIEEAPAPGLPQPLREKLYDKARKAAAAVGYRGAGTVEFLLNADNEEEFYFMEMNVRLQVEHPVTEAITSVDLVEWQLEEAAGNPIPLRQDEITCTGHAFEYRVYAESPRNLLHHRPPASSDTVRVDTGIRAGDDVSVHYDPLISKLIVRGPDRTAALRALRKALNEYQIVGPSTNLEFLSKLAENEAFIQGEVETGFISKHHNELFPPLPTASSSTLAGTALYLSQRELSHYSSLGRQSAWTDPKLAGFRLGGVETNRYWREHELGSKDEEATVVKVAPTLARDGAFDIAVSSPSSGNKALLFFGIEPSFSPLDAVNPHSTTLAAPLADQLVSVDIVSSNPPPAPLSAEPKSEVLHVFNTAENFAGVVEVKPPAWMEKVGSATAEGKGGKGAAGGAKAPMPSKIVAVFVKEGDVVEEGAPLVAVEAMKTEHTLRAAAAGVVSKITVQEGDLVPEGKVLVEFAVDAAEEVKQD
ncbi:hypothetical protein JCM10213v2_007267 [Rhodosporidiobolus nylandii]